MRVPLASTLRSGCFLGVAFATVLTVSSSAQIRVTALLTAIGRVSINGAGIPDTTAVISGDRIQTSSDGAATLSLPGSTVSIPADSLVVFQGDHLEVQVGTAAVSTTHRLQARIERYVIAPVESSPVRFEVTRRNGSIAVTADAGTLIITGAGTTTLEAGRSAIVSESTSGAPRLVHTGRGSGKAVAGAGIGGGAAAIASTMATARRKPDHASPVHP